MSVCRHCGSDHLFTGGKCRKRERITDAEIDARNLRLERLERKAKQREIKRKAREALAKNKRRRKK